MPPILQLIRLKCKQIRRNGLTFWTTQYDLKPILIVFGCIRTACKIT